MSCVEVQDLLPLLFEGRESITEIEVEDPVIKRFMAIMTKIQSVEDDVSKNKSIFVTGEITTEAEEAVLEQIIARYLAMVKALTEESEDLIRLISNNTPKDLSTALQTTLDSHAYHLTAMLERLQANRLRQSRARAVWALRDAALTEPLADVWADVSPQFMSYEELPQETLGAKRLENAMREISGFSRLFAARVDMQAEQINLLHDDAVMTLDSMQRGNVQLWRAHKHLTRGTKMIVAYLLAATACLWMLHYIND
ncbi:SNARE protein syntaxin 18/UFE1 [Carpediemonas membranifera]|uniref:SNARE protein syntaxin 18/UFE1 n=1 Tax=Carpediemonas membranifera TaxID=201153 RepID=A0A8J6BYA6_9EUKA|nr:SNARE protein syntaxin 18/UFE1 [Carpediemonas membranifera]|eukprot:KAG9394296.1 SNARE protein syntaxin 18/UFE1 [Carpediemonas membranifera]